MKGIWVVSVIVSILILGTLGFFQEAEAASFTAVQSGGWNDPATWGGTVPGNTDDKIIPSVFSVTIPDFDFISHEVGTIDNFGTINLDGVDNFLIIQVGGTLNNFGAINIISADGGNVQVNGAGSTLNNFGTININPLNSLGNNNGGITNNQCGGTINNQGFIGVETVIIEILCIPNLVAPADASTVTEPKPDLVWENDAELRLVEYSPNLERTSNPGVPIELVSLSLVSAEPLNDLSNGNHEWLVSVDLAPAYSPGYLFSSSPANSETFSFIVDLADPHTGILEAIADAKDMILDAINSARTDILSALGLVDTKVDELEAKLDNPTFGLAEIKREVSNIETQLENLEIGSSERDNVVLTSVELEANERLIIVDNAGIGGTSDVEVTMRSGEDDDDDDDNTCTIQILVGGAWTDLAMADFPVTTAGEVNVPQHGDALGVEAVSLFGGTEGCELDEDGGYVAVSTVGSSP